MEFIKIENQTARLLEGLRFLYDIQHFCDCSLITNKEPIFCHQVVLAACSTYLRNILLENNNQRTHRVDCSQFSQDIIQEVVLYMYSGTCTISEPNVTGLVKISFLWQLESLYQECVTFIKHHLTLRNVTKYYQLACLHQNYDLKEITSRFIRKHFTDIYNFKHLSVSSFHTLLQYNEINCDENEICCKVIDWINYNSTDDGFVKLCKAIRFDHLTNQYLHDIKHNPLMKDEGVQEQITLAISFQDNNERHGHLKEKRCWNVRPDIVTPDCVNITEASPTNICKEQQTLEIKTSSQHQQTLPIKTRTKSQQTIQSLADSPSVPIREIQLVSINRDNELFGLRTVDTGWYPMLKVPEWMNDGSAICNYTDGIIIAGAQGSYNGRCAILINIKTEETIALPLLPVKLQYAGLAYNKGFVYIVGGLRTSSTGSLVLTNRVLRLCLNCTRGWEDLPPMKVAVRQPIVLIDKSRMYVLGGVDITGDKTAKFQIYHNTSRVWEDVFLSVPQRCTSAYDGSILLNGNLIILANSMCMIYSIAEQKWSVQSYDGTRVIGRHIICLEDSTHLLSSNTDNRLCDKKRSSLSSLAAAIDPDTRLLTTVCNLVMPNQRHVNLQTYDCVKNIWTPWYADMAHCTNHHYVFKY